MICSSWILISALVATTTAKTVQQPPLHYNGTRPSVSNKLTLTIANESNNAEIEALGDPGRDPKYFSLFRNLGQDLSDKSTYLNILRVLRDLAKLPITSHFHGGRWSAPGYEDVMVAIDPHPELQVNYAMWALEDTYSHMYMQNFDGCLTHLYYNRGRGIGPVEVGLLQVSRPIGPTLSTGINSTTALGSVRNATVGNITSTDMDSDEYNVGPSTITAKSLSARDWEIRQNLNGRALTKNIVFTLIYGAIIRMAELPRSRFPLRAGASVRDGGWELEMRPWDAQATFTYDQLQYMLYKIPLGMYANRQFKAGSVVLVVDEQFVGYAEFKRSPLTAVA